VGRLYKSQRKTINIIILTGSGIFFKAFTRFSKRCETSCPIATTLNAVISDSKQRKHLFLNVLLFIYFLFIKLHHYHHLKGSIMEVSLLAKNLEAKNRKNFKDLPIIKKLNSKQK